MISSQMLKGMLEGCILKIIVNEETYGYEISENLKKYGFSDISEGTIYPILLRLERDKLICAAYRESSLGPKRKYYSITDKGIAELSSFYLSWKELSHAINNLFQKERKQDEQ